jgi:hypothetical protein
MFEDLLVILISLTVIGLAYYKLVVQGNNKIVEQVKNGLMEQA